MTQIITKEKLDRKYILSEYFSFVKNYKGLFILTLFMIAITEVRQIVDKLILKNVMDKAELFISGSILINVFVKMLLIAGLVFIGVMAVSFTAGWLRIHFLNRIESKMIFDLKQKYFNHIIGLDHKFFTSNKTGSLISRLGRGGSAMERMTDSIVFEFAPLTIQAVALIGTLIYLDKASALIVFLILSIFLLFSLYMQKKIDALNQEANKTEDIEKGTVADIFTNVDSIKYFGKEGFISSKFKKVSGNTRDKALLSWEAWKGVSLGQNIILGLGTLTLMTFSFIQFMKGDISLGTLTFVYTAYLGITGPMYSFVHGIRSLSRSITDFEDLFNYGKEKSNIVDKENAKTLKILHGSVKYENASFCYGTRCIFRNFSLDIPKGKKIAFVGHSGSGKTTLVKMLYRLYDVTDGSIKIDGQDIRDFKQESLRSEMAIVPQECVLFDDTIYNNIAFSRPDATRKEVLKAIKFAQLDKIIEKFPNKEDTIVGERGVKLSGGEKQRVSIARAILANKKILVLDEATSSLDSETEFEIQQDLRRLMEGRTSIIIAHRLSTIMHADMIIVLKNGKMVQTGKHSKLIEQEGEYKKLWNLQKGGYIE